MAHLVVLGRVSGAGERIEAPRGASLLALVRRAGVPLGRSCGGRGVCRSCGVEVIRGQERLSPVSAQEARWSLPDGSRLACQARVLADASDEGIVELWHPAWGPRASDEDQP